MKLSFRLALNYLLDGKILNGQSEDRSTFKYRIHNDEFEAYIAGEWLGCGITFNTMGSLRWTVAKTAKEQADAIYHEYTNGLSIYTPETMALVDAVLND